MMGFQSTKWSKWLVGLIAVAALALSGCGGDDNACAGVSCEFGVCQAQSGQCVNPSQCTLDAECLPGYGCADSGVCEAQSICETDAQCEVGVCESGTCVNPASCDSDAECLERSFCGPDQTCEFDPCTAVECARGVCDRGTDNCVSAETCTVENELEDCVSGQRCIGGSCETADAFCAQLGCERGVCSFDEGACVNANDCAGDDERCAYGFFCNDQDRCQRDLCEQHEVDCADSGVCVPTSGRCQNARNCQTTADCTEDHSCVESTCQHDSVACGDAEGDGGCPANQLCEVADGQANCTEPERCETSLDCIGDRQCSGRRCIDSVSCPDDAFEPNENPGQATQFVSASKDGSLRGALCSSDTDFFQFHSADLFGAAAAGELVVELDVPRRDQGLGELEVELSNSSGSVDAATTGTLSSETSVRLNDVLTAQSHGDYYIKVSGADDIAQPGVGYRLSVNLVSAQTQLACDAPRSMALRQRLSASTDDSTSLSLSSSCVAGDDSAEELIFALELDQPREIAFDLHPQLSTVDLSMSVRTDCLQPASELGCTNQTGAGSDERLVALLGAGTHYVVVQAAEADSGGPFELLAEPVDTLCASSDDYCEDNQDAMLCAADGDRFERLECDEGCHPSAGRCIAPEGDSCADALPLDPANYDGGAAVPTFTEELSLAQMTDRHGLSIGGCVPDAATRTDGPDQVFEVRLPAQTVLEAELDSEHAAGGALYLLDACGSDDDSCVAGAGGGGEAGAESLTYSNETDADLTLYLVVDTDTRQPAGTAQLTTRFEPLICSPGEDRCSASGDVETCGEYGLQYDHHRDCAHGCRVGQCRDGDTCGLSIPLADGDSYNADFGGTLDMPTGTGDVGQCSFSSFEETDENDQFFEISLQQNETLTVTYDTGVGGAQTSYGNVYLLEDCSSIDTCIMTENRISLSDQPYTFSYQADQDETVILVVGRHSGISSSGTYQIDVEIQ